MEFQTADLYDQHGDNLQVAEPLFKAYGNKTAFCGEIVTIKCHEDNSLVKAELAKDGSGKVLVVDGGGSLRRALVGDQLAANGIKNNWAGIVVFGCIRDSKLINEMTIGIKALNTNPAKTEKLGVGQLNVAVNFANVTFTPGHYVYADEDGIVVSKEKLV
ncbi:MAG: ribonuclease E activity regulator RraA [Bacteroidetes bacterium]|nr:ribonuclease E activity regulator RraA [Bacteroidota bacterium]